MKRSRKTYKCRSFYETTEILAYLVPLLKMLKIILCLVGWMASHTVSHGWEVVKNDPRGPPTCLTGRMIDAQSWVNGVGQLTEFTDKESSIDLSGSKSSEADLVNSLRKQIAITIGVKYLSLARRGLVRVPMVFDQTDLNGRKMAETVEQITFYGNQFNKWNTTRREDSDSNLKIDFGQPGLPWASGFRGFNFTKLWELDLRRCSIETLDEGYFQGMMKLEALYLGENCIIHIPGDAFLGLSSLVHLDLSSNSRSYESTSHMFINVTAFKHMPELTTLDLSFSKLDRSTCVSALENLGGKIKMLSLCHTSLTRIPNGIFRNTSITHLDVSGNLEILEESHALTGLENSLQVLYADNVDLRSLEMFTNFQNLEILRLRNNELVNIPATVMATFENLQILDLAENRLITWLEPVLDNTTTLKLLSVRDNNLNLISEEMMEDFYNLSYLAISGNNIVCNCYSRELFEVSHRNEDKNLGGYLKTRFQNNRYPQSGFQDYNNIIETRQKVTKTCENKSPCNKYTPTKTNGKYLLTDFEVETLTCLLSDGQNSTVFNVPTCKYAARDDDYPNLQKGWTTLWTLIVIPVFVFPLMIFVFVFRKNLRYFCVMVKNTATLSLINQSEVIDDGSIFTYDVFVSYCNEDRDWVLDYLLPHLEQDCSVSVCLHERDFQVGLSILENIVSCMDRSKSILLVLSRRFLLSHWCQFEMHLAQHRLLETRREDLILILLEEIPRAIRPTTLHYLMLTKTYAIWPEDTGGQQLFWRRLKKSLLARRLVHKENVSWT